MEETSTEDRGQIDRLWQHGLHEDTVFNERLNFFLVFESVLLGLIAMLFDREPAIYKWVLVLLVCLGLAVTLVWSYIQAKQRLILKTLSGRLRRTLPEYRETLEELERHRWRIVSGTALMAYFIPGLIALVWIGLLVIVWP
jgi:hypothetical protein